MSTFSLENSYIVFGVFFLYTYNWFSVLQDVCHIEATFREFERTLFLIIRRGGRILIHAGSTIELLIKEVDALFVRLLSGDIAELTKINSQTPCVNWQSKDSLKDPSTFARWCTKSSLEKVAKCVIGVHDMTN